MAEPTQAQVDQVKTITDTIEQSRIRLVRIAASLASLVKDGRATCQELRAYNLGAMAVWSNNTTMLQIARTNGVPGLPLRAPTPALFSYRGATPTAVGDLVCPTGNLSGSFGGLQGAIAAALAAPGTGIFLPPDAIEVIPAGANVQIAQGPSLKQIETQLGVFPLIPVLIVAAIAVVATSAVIVAYYNYQSNKQITKRTVEVVDANLKTFESATSLRANCITECVGTGQAYDKCAKSCAGAFPPPPQMKLPGGENAEGGGSGGLGLIGWTLLGAGVIVGGRFAYKRWRQRA